MNQTLMIVIIGAAAFTAAFMLLHAATAGCAAYQRRFTDQARNQLEEAFIFINPNKVFLLTIVGTV